MKVAARIEIKGVWLEGGHHAVDARKTEPHQQIDTEGSKDGFGIGLVSCEHAAENNHDNEYVKNKAQDYVQYRKRTDIGLTKHDPVEQGRNGKYEGKDEEAAVEIGRVHAN